MKDKKTTKSEPKDATCPICGGDVTAYEGDNPFKAGTGICAKDGRVKIE